jgi:hypothetical protein
VIRRDERRLLLDDDLGRCRTGRALRSYIADVPYDVTMDTFRRGENAEAGRLAQSDLTQAVAAGDVGGQVQALCMLARVALREGDLGAVKARADEARALAVDNGMPQLQRMPVHLQAVASRLGGNLSEARELYLQSIDLAEQLGDARLAAIEHRNLAYAELRAGEEACARELFAESRRRLAGLDTSALLPYLTFDEATVAALDHDFPGAARKLEEADNLFAAAGVIPDPDDAVEIERLRELLAQPQRR